MTKCQIEFCKKCHEALAELGEIPLHYYVNICIYYSAGLPVFSGSGSFGKGNTLTHLLEKVGYIVTTEVSEDSLIIVPTGHEKLDEVSHKFSPCLGDHEKQNF
ncbi:MAG TPA: hypothetical protein VKZ95_01320 [Sphingobacteriaceae bacterium]|nr:hypothetical protein [Sphingobacteriaceae bacterium]